MSSQVIWITGLPGSGKSTLASVLADLLRASQIPVVWLDGDEIRRFMVSAPQDGDYSRNARVELGRRYVDLAAFLRDQDVWVVASVVALYREVHEYRKLRIQDAIEVVLDYKVDELALRDPKGLYRARKSGAVQDLIGIDFLPDWPEAPQLTLSGSLVDNLAAIEALASHVSPKSGLSPMKGED